MSTVIKAGSSGPVLKRLSTVDLADHLAEAQAVIAEARRRAAEVISKAERDTAIASEEAKKAGYEAGYHRGFAEGETAGREAAHRESIERFNQMHADIVADMEAAIDRIDGMKEDLRVAAERDVLDFAVSIASKLTFAIGREFPDAVRENLQRALRVLSSRTDLTIRVHPQDTASLETFADSVLKKADGSRSVCLVPDDSIAPGGCKVLSGSCEIDATLDTQVDEMIALLVGRKGENG